MKLGQKLSDGFAGVARLGKKVLGETARIGHKISSEGGKILSAVERVPVIGQALAPATGVGRSAIGLVQNVADIAETGEKLLGAGEAVVRGGASAIRTGDVEGAIDAIRRGRDIKSGAKSDLERARKVATDAVALGRSSQSAFAQTGKNLKSGVAGAILGGLSDP